MTLHDFNFGALLQHVASPCGRPWQHETAVPQEDQ